MTEREPQDGESLGGWTKPHLTHEQVELEERYQHEVAAYRGAVYEMFRTIPGKPGFPRWAIFELPAKVAPFDEIEYNTNREILFRLMPNPEQETVPTIRIITNEFFDVQPKQFLTEDFILDHENDAQYFVDALELTKQTQTTRATLFYISEGGLELINESEFTPVMFITHESRSMRRITPLGNYRFIQDRFDALQIGRELLGEVRGEQPTYYGPE